MQRNQIIKILIVVLVVFNLVQWWPHDANDNKVEDWQDINISQLKINGVMVNTRYKNTRNLFYADDIVASIKPEIMAEPINESNHSGLPGVQLVGVIFKKKYYEAFLIKGEERYKVRVNNYVTRRYKVKHINIKSIKLKDIQTGRIHKILLSDK